MLQRNHIVWSKGLSSPQDEHPRLEDLFQYGYAISAMAAGAAVFCGTGLCTGLLVFWLGGVAAVFALGLVLARRKLTSDRKRCPEGADGNTQKEFDWRVRQDSNL